jgi:hypothetical protein
MSLLPRTTLHSDSEQKHFKTLTVLNPGKGVCADPVERGAILEVKGPGPPSGDSDRQLSPDRGGGKT